MGTTQLLTARERQPEEYSDGPRCVRAARFERWTPTASRRSSPSGTRVASSSTREDVADSDVGPDVALQDVSRPTTEQHPSPRRADDADHAQVGIQERHGDREPHPDRVHGPASLEEQGVSLRGRGSSEPTHPFAMGPGDVDAERRGTRSDHHDPWHASTLVTRADTTSWAWQDSNPRHEG